MWLSDLSPALTTTKFWSTRISLRVRLSSKRAANDSGEVLGDFETADETLAMEFWKFAFSSADLAAGWLIKGTTFRPSRPSFPDIASLSNQPLGRSRAMRSRL